MYFPEHDENSEASFKIICYNITRQAGSDFLKSNFKSTLIDIYVFTRCTRITTARPRPYLLKNNYTAKENRKTLVSRKKERERK